MAIKIQQCPTFVLIHPTDPIGYAFVLRGDHIEVVHTSTRDRSSYSIPITEARALWLNLRNKGYERF